MNTDNGQSKIKARRSRSDAMYGVYPTEKEDVGKGWKVIVNKAITRKDKNNVLTKTQTLAFPSKRFYASSYSSDSSSGLPPLEQALADAIKYRDENLEKCNLPKVKIREVELKIHDVNTLFVSENKRYDGAMYGITRDRRFLSGERESSGWRVRLHGRNEIFMDVKHGGEKGALKKAIELRDSLVKIEAERNPDKQNLFYKESPLREIRDQYNINQATAAIWMGISIRMYQSMERNEGKASIAFIELFRRFANGTLDPNEMLSTPNPKAMREYMNMTQTEMSELLTGERRQSPWSNWETGRYSMPIWAWKYLNLVAMKEFNK